MARLTQCLRLAILLLTILTAFPIGAEEVWALRTRFTVTMGGADIDYAEADAQWRVQFSDKHIAADNMGFAIAFDDGRVLRNTDLAPDRAERSVLSTPFGEGTRCHVRFEERDGLVVEHYLTLFRDRAFVLLSMAVTNTGDVPVTVTRFMPVVADPGHFAGLGPSTEVTRYPLRIRSGEPVYDPSGPSVWTRFHDPATGRALAIGVLPSGDVEGGADLKAVADGWEGEVFFDHSPGARLAPGARVETGTVWLAAGISDPKDMALNYGWAYTLGRESGKNADMPSSWVTVPDDEGLNDLLRVARIHRPDIRSALIPATWEGRPGSMRGATPGYPGDMASAARQLAALEVAPGITLDPLAGDGGKQDWMVTTGDGQTWLDPSHPEAAEAVRKRVRRAIRWGFQFIAVAPSAVPNEALQTMKLTRARANVLALGLAREAGGNAPVVVAGSGASSANPLDWRLAADAIKSMDDYGASPAPMRLNLDLLTTLTEEGSAALRDWKGPIEVVGSGKSDLRRTLARDVLAGRGGRPRPAQPALLAEEAVESEEVAEAEAEVEVAEVEVTEDALTGEDAPPEEKAEGRGFLRSIKNLGRSVF